MAWADNAIKLAVEMTVAAASTVSISKEDAEQQARKHAQAMRILFPEAVILVREAREGFHA